MPYQELLPIGRDGLTGLQSTGAGRPPVVWLLEITWAGRVWRWSTYPVHVQTRAGESLAYDGGLPETTPQRTLATLSDTPDLLSVSMELLWPDGVDVAELIEQGHALANVPAELSAWMPGQLYEERAVLVDGIVSQPQYGYLGEPVALSVVEDTYDDVAIWPPLAARVTASTWPDYHEDSLNLPYPTAWGGAGVYRDESGTEMETPATLPLMVEVDGSGNCDTLLVCGHRSVATSATVHWRGGAGADGSQSVSLDSTRDGLGRLVTTVDVSTIGAAVGATEWYITWDSGGALPSLDDTDAIVGAGDLLMWWLSLSSLRIDIGAVAALRPALNAWVVAGYVDERVTPWEWVAANLLPLLPVSIVSGPKGLRPVLWRWQATSRDAVAHLVAGEGCVLTQRVSYDRKPREVVSEVQLSWAYDAEAREYRRTTSLGPDRDSSDPESHTSAVAHVSRSRAPVDGSARVHEMTTDLIYDEATAHLVTSQVLGSSGYALRTLRYEVSQELAWLDLGDVVTITDTGLWLSSRPALVTSWSLSDLGRVVLELQLTEYPSRTPVSTGPDPTGGDYDPGWGT